MPKKPTINVIALNVKQVTVTSDGTDDALVELEIDGQANVGVRLSPSTLAKLEAMLTAAAVEQSKRQPVQ